MYKCDILFFLVFFSNNAYVQQIVDCFSFVTVLDMTPTYHFAENVFILDDS